MHAARNRLVEDTLHPVVADLLSSARPAADGTVVIPEPAIERLRASLGRLAGTFELGPAVLAVLAFAGYLDRDCASSAAALRLLQVIAERTEAIGGLLDEVVGRATQRVEQSKAALSNLDGLLGNERRRLRAPRVEEPAPAGATRVSQIYVPRKLAG